MPEMPSDMSASQVQNTALHRQTLEASRPLPLPTISMVTAVHSTEFPRVTGATSGVLASQPDLHCRGCIALHCSPIRELCAAAI